MGGGDLNLKKSWHPSTMKNMEKVWKAEQQDSQEKKKIAELRRDIEREKDKEDMTRYAMEQGVIAKKDDKKLDWMYKGPNQEVNREDYLLGKPIGKSFEQIAQVERDAERNRIPSNHVDHECIPPSLRLYSGDDQIDLQRKIQEDPLYTIKKKEVDSRTQLLNNPVKLKQLKELVGKKKANPETSSSRHHKSSKRHRDSHRSKEDNDNHQRKKKIKLSDEEREKRLKEMLANASWRDKERVKNVKRYREEEKKEQKNKSYDKDFIRKHLAKTADSETVASRIKANINNIQRSGRAMDTHFARRQ